jgi:hypothetical protein
MHGHLNVKLYYVFIFRFSIHEHEYFDYYFQVLYV